MKTLVAAVLLLVSMSAWGAPPPPPYLDRHKFGDDTPILSSVLHIDQHEYQQTIEAGTAQRMRVYFKLFKAMVLEQKFPADIEAIIPQKFVERILTEEGYNLAALRELYRGKTESDINLFYGPDLIKSDAGTWFALEDNFGTGMGGLGDAQLIHDDFRKRHKMFGERRALGDFKNLYANFFKIHNVNPKTQRVVAFVPPDEEPDEYTSFEYSRLKNLFIAHGIEVMDPNEMSAATRADLMRHPPAAIINTVDPIDDESRDFIYNEFFKARSTPLYISPGSIVLSNKAFLPFVNPLARHLGLRLPITSPESVLLNKGLPRDLLPWVIKEAYGASGDQVYIARDMSAQQRAELRARYRTSTGIFIGQHLVTPDKFDTPYGKFIYDIRPLVHFASGRLMYVTPTPWARASQTNKVNISKGGANLVIIQTPRCEDLFH